DPLAPPALLALPLRLARDVDALVTVGLWRLLEGAQELVHVGLEGVERTEARDVDGAEEVADVRAGRRPLGAAGLGRPRGAGEDAAEDVDHEGQAVALVAALLPGAPERGEEPGLVGEGRVGGGTARRVESPALGDRPGPAGGHR